MAHGGDTVDPLVDRLAPGAGLRGDVRRDLEDWVAAGCPGRVIAPGAARFAALAARGACVARVVDELLPVAAIDVHDVEASDRVAAFPFVHRKTNL